jgi:hypothetical protein
MSGILHAQHFNINSFKKDAADPSASMYSVRHFNGDYCALIKVLTNAKKLEFETTPDLEKIELKKTGEYWVYVSPGIKRIIIRKDGFIPKEYVIPTDIKIESKITYIMELEGKADGGEDEPQPEFVIINSEPTGASVYFKNPVNDEYEYKGKTPYQTPMLEGEYEYKLTKKLYSDYIDNINVIVGNTVAQTVNLKPNFGSIKITSNPENGAIILLNGDNISATTPFTNLPV